MARWFYLSTAVLFAIGAAAGLMLLVMSSIDGETRELGRLGLGTIALTAAAWSARRAWQREKQKREFLREIAAEKAGD